jgi:hypothetical protein
MTHPTISGHQDPDERSRGHAEREADALVAALERSASAPLADVRLPPRIRELLYLYVDALSDSALPPERMVVSVKAALLRARHRRADTEERSSAEAATFDAQVITAAIRRFYAPRE